MPLLIPSVICVGPGTRHPPHTSPNITFDSSPEEDFGSRRSRYRDDESGSQNVRFWREHGGRSGCSRRHGSRERRRERSRNRSPILAIPPRQSSNAPESSSRSIRKPETRDSKGRRGGGGGGNKKFNRSSHRSSRQRRSPTPR
ncbi:unnamed protein product [Rodentolepis nana]|uniref:Uncharacterized protein n=1 Tax=Rodentolepis nana TaxID=102285 RepID=A0A0R3THA7_RODNA|nr:unnamed protein product [Rodentolepis nana]